MALPAWTALPFALLLLAVAVLPLAAEPFWRKNGNKALVAALLAAPVVVYLLYIGRATGWRSNAALLHEIGQYGSFIILLASLYTISGGILLRGPKHPSATANTLFLLAGAVLANLIGTTGASILLIRPVLQLNRGRKYAAHVPVFFIFIVSNLGGLLTPLGDPPLFLGFLNGVDFLWTLTLLPQWLTANGVLLALFFVWDALSLRREPRLEALEHRPTRRLHMQGIYNALFLVGVAVAVLMQSPKLGALCGTWASRVVPCGDLTLVSPWGEAVMVLMAVLSLALTPQAVRKANEFSWGAIVEVAVLFAGIFVTMTPALSWLGEQGPHFGLTQPWQFFWLSGALSSVLDNAPTYVTFATLAAGPHGDFGWLAHNRPLLLQAVSCGSVFMGANTYIGNGPNMMVKAVAEEAGVRMPSFFGYLLYSGLVLLPLFGLITLLFFWPA